MKPEKLLFSFSVLLLLLLLNLHFSLLKNCFYICYHLYTQFSQLYTCNKACFYCIFLQVYYVYNALHMPFYLP